MEHDHPDIVVRPPLLYGGALAATLVLRWLAPWPMDGGTTGILLGIALVGLGLALGVPGRRALAAAGTDVNPTRPTTALVTTGSYRLSRNPLYVGLTAMFVGLTLAVDTWWGLVWLAPVLVVLHHGVILREEEYLARKFGERYREYCGGVRRYL